MKKLNRKDYCLSCEHVLSERGYVFEQEKPLQGFPVSDSALFCKNCGQKINPELEAVASDVNIFLTALSNPKIKVVAFVAPSVRAGIGEAFNIKQDCQHKIVTALKKLGAHAVFSMNFGADLTIMEESKEFAERLSSGKNLPLLTSCCPAWVNYLEKMQPELLPNLSSCKSPQQMMGAIINSYYAEQEKLLSTELFVVSVVPCIAKKLERIKSSVNSRVGYDVDACITTKELSNIIKNKNIDFAGLADGNFDRLFADYSGGGAGFGMAGGVSEAVVNNLFENATYTTIKKDGYIQKIAHTNKGNIYIAQVQGVTNTNKLFDDIKTGKSKYHLVEVMACEGGCIGGPGQPSHSALAWRKNILKHAKQTNKNKNAKDNPIIKKLYKNYLSPQKATDLLHVKK